MQTEPTTEPTTEPPTDDALYQSAHKRAEELQGFYIHLLVYLAVNTGLFVINLLTRNGDGTWWFYWPLAGWGIGLAIHALTTFAGLFSEDWKERKAAEIYERTRHQAG
jgi:2TM domain-containing protein